MNLPLEAPVVPRDFSFLYDGLKAHRLLVQLCDNCQHRRHPPVPSCPRCRSLEWTAVDAPLSGSIHSFVVHHYPVFPDYSSPHVVALVDLEPGLRVVGALFDVDPSAVVIGMPVDVSFAEHKDGFILHYFKPSDVE